MLPAAAAEAGKSARANKPASGEATKAKVSAEFPRFLLFLIVSFPALDVRRRCQTGFEAVLSKGIGFDGNSVDKREYERLNFINRQHHIRCLTLCN